MEKIESMKIHRAREGKKSYDVPKSLSFHNADGEEVLNIRFDYDEVHIFQRGVEVTMFDKEEYPLYQDTGRETKWVTTFPMGERVFPEDDPRIDPYKQTKMEEEQ